jgi:ribosomal protein S18 acetylase RimI-like enzyme
MAIQLARLSDGALGNVIRFVESWSDDDAYDRFGLFGRQTPQMLLRDLANNPKRRALLAFGDGRLIGLLDYVTEFAVVHFGIVVGAQYRRRRIGTALVGSLLKIKRPEWPVAAECRPDNRAANTLLRVCGFERIASERDGILWRHS